MFQSPTLHDDNENFFSIKLTRTSFQATLKNILLKTDGKYKILNLQVLKKMS